jgi:hypothetical protein
MKVAAQADAKTSEVPPLERARHYQELAHRHPDEERFWLCRASYFGRVSADPEHHDLEA